MHTSILFAVQANSPEDAVDRVYNFTDRLEWSDWNEHQGRWEGEIPNGVICYSEDKDLFLSTLDKYVMSTNQEEIEFLKQVGHLTVEELISDPRYSYNIEKCYASDAEKEAERQEFLSMSKEEQELHAFDQLYQYRALKLFEMNMGRCIPETHFYDAEEGTRSPLPLKERFENAPEKQYLVMWDLHY